jgi:CBS domain-containing protein
MKVRDLMMSEVETCAPETTLAAVAQILREHNFGALPVVHDGRAIAMVTDRDICIALAGHNRRAADMSVQEAMSTAIHVVGEDDAVGRALQLMRRWRVRRLPVVDREGTLKGILTLNDVALRATPAGNGGPSWADLVNTIQAIFERQRPVAAHARRQPASLRVFH